MSDVVRSDNTDDEYEPDYDGHPSWYEPTQCSGCDMLFMPSNEEASHCDNCEDKKTEEEQEQLLLPDGTIHDYL